MSDEPQFQCEYCEKFFPATPDMIRDTGKFVYPNEIEPTATFICEDCFRKTKDQV